MDHPLRRKSDHTWYRWLVLLAPRHIKIGVFISLMVWGWLGFKQIEPDFLPVVTDFVVDSVEVVDDGQRLSGSMNKVRDCEFIQLIAYSGDNLVAVGFSETPVPVSRVEGVQSWGWWVITPPIMALTLYARHNCATGRVTTKLFEGEL